MVVLIVLAAVLITRPWAGDDSAPTDTTGEEADTVRVRRGAYVGEPVKEVRAALEDKGLSTKTENRTNPGGETAGTVADLDPTGEVETGSTITLQVWGDPPVVEDDTDEDDADDAEDAEEKARKEAEKEAEKAEKEAEDALKEEEKQPAPSSDPSQGSGGPPPPEATSTTKNGRTAPDGQTSPGPSPGAGSSARKDTAETQQKGN